MRTGSSIQLMQSFDWEKSPLGPKQFWNEALIATVSICLNHPTPSLIAWGPELIQIYNDAYAELIQHDHPDSFGKPGRVSWKLQWPQVEPVLQQVMSGKSFCFKDQLFKVGKTDPPEDRYFNVSYEPILTRDGVGGILAFVERSTRGAIDQQKIRELEETLRKNEGRSRLGIEAAGLGTFEYDIVSEKWENSARMAEIFDLSTTDVPGHMDFKQRVHPEDMPIRNAAIEAVEETGRLFYEVRILWADTSVHWVRINGVMLENDLGKPTVLYGTAQDITEMKAQSEWLEGVVAERTQSLLENIRMLKLAEDKIIDNAESLRLRNRDLHESEERYHRMIDEVQDYAIILLDNEGIIQNWNEGAAKIKEYSEAEAIGRHFSIFYLPEDRAQGLPQKLIDQALTHGRATHEGWRVRKSGSRFWGSIVITSLHDKEGSPIGFSKVTRDLTERKASEDALRGYASALEARNKELEQFAFVASHDLQEPLRKIQTFVELIQNNLQDVQAAKRYFDKINVAAQRMRDLILATLNYSALSRDDLALQCVDLNNLLEEVKVDNEVLIQSRNALVRAHHLPLVHGNPIQLSQVFANLISNAIKFSKRTPIIDITSSLVAKAQVRDANSYLVDEKYFEVIVKDNGIGFDARYSAKIFSIFQRLHGKDEYPGTGIGLALVKKIMENHHGHITASSTPGEGASFYLYFPYLN